MSSTPCNFFCGTFLFFNMFGFSLSQHTISSQMRGFFFGWGGVRKSDLGKERNRKKRAFGCSPLPRTEIEEEEEEGKTEKATNGC